MAYETEARIIIDDYKKVTNFFRQWIVETKFYK